MKTEPTLRTLKTLALMFACAALSSCSSVKPENTGRKAVEGWLVPTPKKVEIGGDMVLAPPFAIADSDMKLPPLAMRLLRDELKDNYGWKEAAPAEARCLIKTEKADFPGGNEAYGLEIKEGGILIRSGSDAGLWRAVNRLRATLASEAAKCLPDDSIKCAAIAIEDWPDFPLRGMHLQMSQSPEHERRVKETIDAMAKLGYNLVVLEVGGRFESKKHPECSQRPWWTQQQIKDLVAFAKARGVTPVPGINSIGHAKRSPLVFMLEGVVDGKKQPVAMNIAHPQFYEVYFDMLSELCGLFDNPPYLHLGLDEINHDDADALIEKATGKTGHEYLAEFVNKTSARLAREGVRVVMWHDMLVAGAPDGATECLNGARTHEALKKIDNDVIIDYWCYSELDRYKGLERIAGTKREIWVSPWFGQRAVPRLCSEGKRLGVSGVLGTTWSCSYRFMAGVVLTAEFSWNAPQMPTMEADARQASGNVCALPCSAFPALAYSPQNVVNAMFYGRGSKRNVPGVSQVTVTGLNTPSKTLLDGIKRNFPTMTVDAHGLPVQISTPHSFFSFGSVKPLDFDRDSGKLGGLIKARRLLLANNRDAAEWIAPTSMNRTRDRKEVVLYTPDYGASTRTNTWGTEWIVEHGKVTGVHYAKGNAVIPASGYVLSAHGRKGNEDDFFGALRVGDRISLYERTLEGRPLEPITITAPFENASTIVMLLTLERPVDMSLSGLAEITMEFADGSKTSLPLKASMFNWIPNNSQRPVAPWRSWSAWQDPKKSDLNSILAVEWTRSNNSVAPKRILVKPTMAGVNSELVVLGGAFK